MMVGMFIIGFVIFALYMFGLLYAIWWGHNSQREEMERDSELQNYYARHNNGLDMDYDGMGNQGRVPSKITKSKNRKFKQRVK